MSQKGWGLAFVIGIAVLVAIAEWRIAVNNYNGKINVARRPRAVMGTTCLLTVAVDESQQFHAQATLRSAEARLRQIEARMSNWLDASEVSRVASADANASLTLSDDTLKVLRQARLAFDQTGGVFDITCRPQVEVWRDAAERGSLPTQAEINAARAASNWSLVKFGEQGIVKLAKSVSVDLGGIAKGYAIDQAMEVLRQQGIAGGLVDVGGDLACFGSEAGCQGWQVDVYNPFGDQPLVRLRLSDCAVATSGNYARYHEIDGKRYSHIIDPRTGQPTAAAESATVIAPSAMVADVWATALSILGPEGIALLPEDTEALLVLESSGEHKLLCSPGFLTFVDGQLSAEVVYRDLHSQNKNSPSGDESRDGLGSEL